MRTKPFTPEEARLYVARRSRARGWVQRRAEGLTEKAD